MNRTSKLAKEVLLAGFLASGIVVLSAGAQSPATPSPSAALPGSAGVSPAQSTAPTQSAPSAQSAALVGRPRPADARHHYQPSRFSRRANLYYSLFWGVDSLSVKEAESGEIIRFSYYVLDPAKAAMLNDKKAEPTLIDPQAGVKLVVPQLEKVGKLRQSSTPVAGKAYWMAFSNKGRLVKPGDRVSVVIGQFHADGLVVD